MTEKRFGYGAGVNWQEDVIIDYETEKSYDFYEVEKLLNALNDENEQLKQQLEYQEEAIVDAIDSLMELPSATIYLLKQWLDAFEEYDSIEDMKNTFSERIKELEE